MTSSSFNVGESSRAREQPASDEVLEFQPRPWVAPQPQPHRRRRRRRRQKQSAPSVTPAMASSSFNVGESSRAREQPASDEVLEFQPRPWVAPQPQPHRRRRRRRRQKQSAPSATPAMASSLFNVGESSRAREQPARDEVLEFQPRPWVAPQPQPHPRRRRQRRHRQSAPSATPAMASSSFNVGESSRAREQTARDVALEFQPRPWVALSSIPIVLDARDERASMLAPGVTDFVFALQHPLLRPSYLVLPGRIVPGPRSLSFPYVVSTCSDRLLFRVTHGGSVWDYSYFLCDIHARTAALLPDVPANLGVSTLPRRSIGLIADRRHVGHYMVAQLQPTSMRTILLCYSTCTDQWTARTLASHPNHEPSGVDGVIAHGGLLWWVDIASGVHVCDPFADNADLHLRFIPLPVCCQMSRLDKLVSPFELVHQRRLIRPSDGKLRYVEIQGVPFVPAANKQPLLNPRVCMFTLVSQENRH
ncbi:hypothetical protein ZEAMMB73_Zm00001d004684 [Zea mays]|nr:hypothetical protein ZEAMMB73_Zm00001d004684 [Zea mays]